MDFDTPYLTQQIIAYIGNKRKLLSLIYQALEASALDLHAPLRFADLFSGSGVVSRFAKQLGFEVYCNDWEPYAEVLSRGFVALDKSEFDALFADGTAATGCEQLGKPAAPAGVTVQNPPVSAATPVATSPVPSSADDASATTTAPVRASIAPATAHASVVPPSADDVSATTIASATTGTVAALAAAPAPIGAPAAPAGFSALLANIDALPAPAGDGCYISRYYAALGDDVDAADFRTERLFYTRGNALAIDKIRGFIEREFPRRDDGRRHVLLALLLYEAATHTNTSGVFKAFHKGFGGHGKDALKRILAPIALHAPVLIDGAAPVHVYRKDANALVRELPPLDVAYLDPPYNQHQYGSNYHLLNTIALWDKVPAPLELDERGVLVNKAAIRADWQRTRSAYCSKRTAAAAFRDLIDHIRARVILVSYSSDGIIPFEEMKAICMTRGYVSIVTSGYTVYRGGKQSNSRKSADIEFVLMIDTARRSTPACAEAIDRVLAERRLRLLLKRRYSQRRLAAVMRRLSATRYALPLTASGTSRASAACPRTICFDCTDGITLALSKDADLAALDSRQLAAVVDALEQGACATKQEELEALITLTLAHAAETGAQSAAGGAPASVAALAPTADNAFATLPRNGSAASASAAPRAANARKSPAARYLKQLPATLKKLAQKKYRTAFYAALSDVRALSTACPALYPLIAAKIDDIARTAELRFVS